MNGSACPKAQPALLPGSSRSCDSSRPASITFACILTTQSARTTVHSITWQHSLPSLRDYAFINSSSLLINPGLVPHVLTFGVTSSRQMAYAPTTIASPPSHACPCLRISNSFAAYWAVSVTNASSCLTWPTTYDR